MILNWLKGCGIISVRIRCKDILKFILLSSFMVAKILNLRGKMPQSGVCSMQGSTECRLPPKVIFHGRLSSTEGSLPPKVVSHRRSSSTEGRLPP